MLYDLSFLRTGELWPPKSECKRIRDYQDYRDAFDGKHADIYRSQFKRIERVIGDYDQVICYPIILNYHRLVSLKTADLVFSRPPKITVSNDRLQDRLDGIIRKTNLFTTAHTSVVDVSRFGDAVLTKGYKADGIPVISASSPEYWFPVVNRQNVNERLYDVQAYHYLKAGQSTDPSIPKRYELLVTIHSPDTTEQIVFDLIPEVISSRQCWRIGGEISRQTIARELSRANIATAHNLLTAGAVYGISDYDIFDSLLSEIMVRVAQISKVLDKHSNPTMSGPASALDHDEEGNPYFKAGGYFSRDIASDPDIEYKVWDASLNANFEQIKLLMHNLYTLTEMGSVLLGDFTENSMSAPSGTALRRLMMSPLAKAARVSNSYDSAIKRLLSDCMNDLGEPILPEDISIIWNDGLPQDPMEDAQIISMRTGSKATLSQWSAIQRLDNMSNDDTNTELEMIREDEGLPPIPIDISTDEPDINVDMSNADEQTDTSSN